MEVTYNQKGARQGQQYYDSLNSGQVVTGEYKLRLNYVEVPVLIQYTDKKFITVGAGFSWGRLVGVQEWEHGKKVETTTVQDGPYNKKRF